MNSTIAVLVAIVFGASVVVAIAFAFSRMNAKDAADSEMMRDHERNAATEEAASERKRIRLEYDSFVSRLEEPDCQLLAHVRLHPSNAAKFNDASSHEKFLDWFRKCEKPKDPVSSWIKGPHYDSNVAEIDRMKPPFTTDGCQSYMKHLIEKLNSKDKVEADDMRMAVRDRYAEAEAAAILCGIHSLSLP